MEHLAIIDRFAHDRITPPVAKRNLLRSPDASQIQGESHRAETAHFTDLGQVATLKGHHHQDVGIGIPTSLTTGQRTEKDHLLGGVELNQPLRERLQRFASHQRGRSGGHGLHHREASMKSPRCPCGAGFTSLRRDLGWLPGAPHPQEESLSRAIGAGLLHLDDPDRLRATAQLFGTGNRWRPLPDALTLLWQASAWRDELRQLLKLPAERTNRRLHSLPWALPVPLRNDAPCIHRKGLLWPWAPHFATLSGMLGLSGFTSTLCSWGRSTRSMSSIGIAPSSTSLPSTMAPVKQRRLRKRTSTGPT